MVKSLGINALKSDVYLCEQRISMTTHFLDTVTVTLRFVVHPGPDQNERLRNTATINCIRLSSNSTSDHYLWWNPELGMKEMVNHVNDIFGCVNTCEVQFRDREEEYDTKILRDTLPEGTGLFISRLCSSAFTQKILEHFLSSSRRVTLQCESLTDIQHVAIQNLDILRLRSQQIPMTLDDFLMCNASYICTGRQTLSSKDINRFLKHWITGSNSRLKYINFGMENPDVTLILKNIPYQSVPEEVERTLDWNITTYSWRSTYRYFHQTMTGGWDIRNKDGTNATVTAVQRNVELVVWD
ncbi:hypothetical protein GCK72_008377 [Caenorhabditis remanei]|uniref:Sdz-33 F-box domain-containing protein n=1 Tax=Caenorhabditis remanei TaxID=31234 RepID=A0A6A5GZI9_CAERE|nr:hypothetical protein GCK72_008377 [Caenorhabditis remanei]KAF1760131.1 hypothetical protein GCK72_008377 [Caenorhabditis remanei]